MISTWTDGREYEIFASNIPPLLDLTPAGSHLLLESYSSMYAIISLMTSGVGVTSGLR